MTLKLASSFCFLWFPVTQRHLLSRLRRITMDEYLIGIYTGSLPLFNLGVSLDLKMPSTVSYST